MNRTCAYCRGPIEPTRKATTRTCTKRCRQALHRIEHLARARATAAHPMRLAYADPPYPGKSKIYRLHHAYAGEVDLPSLLRQLDKYDGWALSSTPQSIPQIVNASVDLGREIHFAAWHRGQRTQSSYWPTAAWEIVIFSGGRHVSPTSTPDSFVMRPGHRLTDPDYIIGAKPAAFCYWIFDLLGAAPNDTMNDLFPGSGIVARCWSTFRARALSLTAAPDINGIHATPCRA